MIETILVAHDGSPAAETTLPAAALLARLFSVPVVLVRVLETMRPFYDPRHGEVIWLSEDEPRLEIPPEELFAAQLSILRERGITAVAVVRLGKPADELVEEARAWPAPVLVLGSHGRGGVGRAVIGSVTDRVVRTASCPVLVVRAGGPALERIEHVLVPLDGSPRAERALPYAIALAERAGARLTLARVAETHRELLLEWRGRPIAPATQERLAAIEEEAAHYLDAIRERIPAGIRVQLLQLSGDPKRQLVAAVARERTDLVVLTTRGKGGLERWLLGSVTERLLTATRVPLFIVPSTEESEVHQAE
jgi:nucleotide-binding universal stress UspA family protein